MSSLNLELSSDRHHNREEQYKYYAWFQASELHDWLTLEDGIDMLFRNVGNHHSTLRNVPEERRSQQKYSLKYQRLPIVVTNTSLWFTSTHHSPWTALNIHTANLTIKSWTWWIKQAVVLPSTGTRWSSFGKGAAMLQHDFHCSLLLPSSGRYHNYNQF